MLRKPIIAAVAAALLSLLSPTDARAWGGMHVGYTHVGPNGVQHYGRTVGVGPYGAYSGGHYGSYGYGGAYHAGYGEGYHYNTGYTTGGAYHYGTIGVGGYGYGYTGGVYRGY